MVKVSRRAIWLSFPLITLGDLTRTLSPQFEEWTASIHSQYNDVPGAGLFLLSFSPFSLVIYLVSTALTIACIQLLLDLGKKSNVIAKLTSVAIGVLFVLLTLSTLSSVWDNLSWRFYILAIGEFVFVSGMSCGLVAYFSILAE